MIRCNLGELLRERRWTISKLARECGLRRATLTAFAAGVRKEIDLFVLQAICRALKVQVGQVLQWVDDGKPLVRPRPKPRPKIPPCGHKRRSRTCYDCLYPQATPGEDEPLRHRVGREE